MQKSDNQDIQKLNIIIKSLLNIQKCFEQRGITNANNLKNDDIAQAACTQFITNIYEDKKKLQGSTYDKLVELNKISLAGARHIASHDYESVDFDIIFAICRQLTKAAILAELYKVLADFEDIEKEVSDSETIH